MTFRRIATLALLAGAATILPAAAQEPQGTPISIDELIGGPAPEPDAIRVARCERMAGLVPGNVTITSSRIVPAGLSAAAPGQMPVMLPEHCLVDGVIDPREGVGGVAYGIGFQLALPLAWNGRYLLQGGGGLNGTVRPALGPVASGAEPALARGFAVASHDSGHKGVVFDQSFMADQRAALDFAETSVRTVTLVTRGMTTAFYASRPHHSYMTGCSTGGREGMLASQRYPELFDGIVVGAPAMRPGFSNLGIEYAQVMLNRTLPAGAMSAAGFSEAERGTILNEVLRQCDALDGSADGMVMNVEGCRAFQPSALRCEAGETDGCISGDRVDALELAFRGPRDAAGRPIYVPIPWDTGIAYDGPGLPGYLPVGTPGPFGPASTAQDIDIDARVHSILWDAAGRLTDTAYWTNLSTFLGHGGKIMYFHGVSDPWFSANDTWDYFQRARQANGADAWDNAARFYMVPGMMHCSGGNAFEQFDLLGPLVEWVEQGDAPQSVVGHRAGDDGSGAGGTMPLCPHPSYAHYDGGPKDDADSYSCRVPDA